MPSGGRISSAFGGERNHGGIDFSDKLGSEIYAAANGTVYFVDEDFSDYGNCIGIDHGNNICTFYAHLDEIFVEEGQEVTAGDVIAAMGSTGNSTGPNLHFEIRRGKTNLDPAKYLPLSSQEGVLPVGSGSCEQILLTLEKPSLGEVSAIFELNGSHSGMDFSDKAGSEIYAAAEGTVVRAKTTDDSDYGHNIVIDHGNGYQTLYAHCDEILVEVGQGVKAGDVIATMGITGNSTLPNLHFELRINGIYTDPAKY